MKLTLRRVLAFFLLIALSIGFGFAWDVGATAIERHRYPMPTELTDKISQYAGQYGVPEPILWATVRTNSRFASNAVSIDGAVGLTQLMPECFEWICVHLLDGEPMDAGMLFDPDTNLSAGCAYLSYLYDRYGVWDHVYAAYFATPELVDTWLADPQNLSNQGVLKNYPDKSTASYVDDMRTAVEYYNKLYYQS